jgi:hypothetical protein
MRIIGGHDYYDSALAYGQDSSVVFVRDKAHIIAHKDIRGTPLGCPSVHIDVVDQHTKQYTIQSGQYWKSIIGLNAYPVRVYIGNKYINGLLVTDISKMLRVDHYIWTYEALEKLLAEYKLTIQRPKLSKTFRKISSKWMRDVGLTPDYFGIKESPVAVVDWMIANKFTIVTVERFPEIRELLIRVNGDNLKDLQFAKAIDPFQIFQLISQWVGGILTSTGNEMVTIADIDKVGKHGFDKWSFRKPPIDSNK